MKKGVVLGFNPNDGGLIRAEDGNRYVLRADAWRGERPAPRVGEEVDFEVNGEFAIDVYPLNAARTADFSNTMQDLADRASRITSDNQIAQKVLVNGKPISASFFALVLIFMCLPFVTVSCDDKPVLEATGIEIVVGKTITPPEIMGRQQSKNIPGEPKAVLIFGAAALGIGASLANHKKSSIAAMGIGACGLLTLLALKSGIDGKIIEEGAGAAGFKTNYGIGFWGSVWMFLSAICLNAWMYLNRGKNT